MKNKETLEKAIKDYTDTPSPDNIKLAFRNGAKFQSERMYSEEEVLNLIKKGYYTHYDSLTIDEWFEQFKKK